MKQKFEEWHSSFRPSRSEEVELARIRIDHTALTHRDFLENTPPPPCSSVIMEQNDKKFRKGKKSTEGSITQLDLKQELLGLVLFNSLETLLRTLVRFNFSSKIKYSSQSRPRFNIAE